MWMIGPWRRASVLPCTCMGAHQRAPHSVPLDLLSPRAMAPHLLVCCVRRVHNKLQKKTAESINSKLQLVMKSGKACLGYKQVLKTLRHGDGQSAVQRCTALRFWGFRFPLLHAAVCVNMGCLWVRCG